MKLLLKKYHNVRQKSLLTDDTIGTRSFYRSLGFKPCSESNTIAFYRDELEDK